MNKEQRKERPEVSVPRSDNEQLPLELFQSKVLRPILKLQHTLLIELFHAYRSNYSLNWEALSLDKKHESVDTIISKNPPLKHSIIGMICGQMNEEEFKIYLQSKKEFDRRITRMAIQRVQSTLS